MKKYVFALSALVSLLIVGCGPSVTIDAQLLKGKWSLSKMYHPMIDGDYERQKKAIDTLTTLDLGQIAMWQTNDVNVVKEKELKIIEDSYKFTKGNIMKTTYHFVNDTLLVKGNGNMQDTCHYEIYDDNKILVKSYQSGGQKDTIIVTELTANSMKLEEPFIKEKILSEFKK